LINYANRYLGLTLTGDIESLPAKFTDADKIAAWAKPQVAACADNNILSGSDGMFNFIVEIMLNVEGAE